MTGKRAFTLIELLVVIAIIALLMGIMMPVLSRVKEHARNLLCQANLHQYGLAERMYLDSNDGFFPSTFDWLFWDAEGRSELQHLGCQWHNASIERDGTLWPYLKDKKIHLCPTFKSFAKQTGCPNPKHLSRIRVEPQYSYSKNAYLNGDASGVVRKEIQVVNPAQVVSFSEENTWTIGDDKSGWSPTDMSYAPLNDNNLLSRGDRQYHPYAPGGGGDCFATYHNTSPSKRNKGYANAVFVDAHVEQVCAWNPPDNTFKLLWPKGKK